MNSIDFKPLRESTAVRACAGVAILLLFAGCATSRLARDATASSSSSLKPAEVLARIFPGEGANDSEQAVAAKPSQKDNVLSLEQVQSIAREKNPTFAEFAASRQAARAEVLQALAYPNPDVSVDLELAPEVFLPIEMPSTRHSRKAAAEAAEPVVSREEDVFRATLASEVARAYATVLYYRRAVSLAEEALRTEREIEQIVVHRVEGGEAPEIDRIKAQVETLKASRLVQLQQRQHASARAVLNALCGRVLPAESVLEDNLERPLPTLDTAQAQAIASAQHPAILRLEALLRQKELLVERERKAWFPSLRLGVPLGLEIPLLNRNKGGIEAAKAELEKVRAELARTRQEIQCEIETSAQAYESAREQLAAFEGGLRASAAESLRIETFRYQEGEVDLLQLLDARRTARQTEAEHLQAMYDAQLARIGIERATGIRGGEE